MFGSRSTEREHRSSTSRHGPDLPFSPAASPPLQQGEAARALEQQQTSTVISKKESLSRKTPVAAQERLPRPALRGRYGSLGRSQSPAQPSVSRALGGDCIIQLPALLVPAPPSPSVEQLPARGNVGSMQESPHSAKLPLKRVPSAAL